LNSVRFAPGLNIQIFTGAKDERNELAETIKKSKFDILLTTYEYILKDTTFFQSFNWKVLIIDEAHRIKNSQSLLHGALKTVCLFIFFFQIKGSVKS
jgi:SNF2 family DNA or RNA helicase